MDEKKLAFITTNVIVVTNRTQTNFKPKQSIELPLEAENTFQFSFNHNTQTEKISLF